jgi:hypothetical protein
VLQPLDDDPPLTNIDPNWWYRRAHALADSPPQTRPVKAQPCVLCSETMVLVPRYECNQFCRNGVACREAGVLRETRLLAPDSEFIRQVEHYGPDTATGESTIRTCGEQHPPPPSLAADIDSVDCTGADAEGIPLTEIAPLERTSDDDETAYGVQRITGVGSHLPPTYNVLWDDGTRAPSQVVDLFNSAHAVVEYWQSKVGVTKGRNWPRAPHHHDEAFHYNDWCDRLKTPKQVKHQEIAYMLAIQLAGIRHPTQNAMINCLKSTGFPEDTLFNVWLVPRSLSGATLHTAVPFLGITYRVLRHLAPKVTWTVVSTRLDHHVARLAMGSTLVPVFFWNTPTDDERWGFKRGTVLDGIPLHLILKSVPHA